AFLFRLLINICLTAAPRSAEQNLHAKFVKMKSASPVSPAPRWGSPFRYDSGCDSKGGTGLGQSTAVQWPRYHGPHCGRLALSMFGMPPAATPKPKPLL